MEKTLRALLIISLFILCVGCATTASVIDKPVGSASAAPVIDKTYRAVSQDSRVRFLIIHYTAIDLPTSIDVLTNRDVSAHYLVTDEAEPRILSLVEENARAYHAGLSTWKNFSNLNSASIGIEIVNPGWVDTPDERVYAAFPEQQIDTLIPLIQDIVKRHDIAPGNILGHNDIAPQRKQDPGPLFPWVRLADLGLINWPDAQQVSFKKIDYDAQLPDLIWFQNKLIEHGFQLTPSGQLDQATRNVVSTFQMKYRPANYDGVPDAETAALLDVITSKKNF
ncbi:N-acetylmuramoyl-L-alanine amidase [Solimicrobium silvestre]|uniref:N-acetylmuramoyl-L-alanine amidase n=1 Tax=Solimicrobium silvestre TaxID=2099400 RepID=A0A2S9H4C6_9BURK|nr:N-acetylmuramoyl-L-alanine amidase [Solimicrobium silvestre]PRC94835.1 Negative regulator of beta-lactamase expression [Solimicrobium silvestre]